jgi:polyhydroxyalkanoate synthesis regulator phasin
MNIRFSSISHEAVFFLKENLLPSLTALQKKIFIVVAIALSFYVAWSLFNRCIISFKAKPLNDDLKASLEGDQSDHNMADRQNPPLDLEDSLESDDQIDSDTEEIQNLPCDPESPDPLKQILTNEVTDIQINKIKPCNIADQLSPFLEKEGIISSEECHELSVGDLIKKMDDMQEAFQTHLKDIQENADAHDYSICLRELEKIEEGVQNIAASLVKKGDINSERENVIENMTKSIEQAHHHIPLGPSVLLQSDMTNLSKITMISKDDYYTNDMGAFFEPKISQLSLIRHFEKLKKEQGYKSITVGWKVSKLYSKSLDTMCSYIAFEKDVSQKPRLWKIDQQPSLSRKSESFSDALKRIVPDISNQIEEWKFDDYKLISYDELTNNYHLSPNKTKKYDFIIFYHKKVDDLKELG